MFREHGIDGIGVDAVMKEAGLTHGGFYLHFPSKEALAAEVSQSLLEKAASRWDRISRSADREAALEAIVRTIWTPNTWRQPIAARLRRLAPTLLAGPSSREAVGRRLRRHARCAEPVLPGRGRNKALAALSTMVGAVVLARLADDPALARAFLRPPPTASFRTIALSRWKQPRHPTRRYDPDKR